MKLGDFGIHVEIQTKTDRCETHGDFESHNVFRNIWSQCPICAADRQAVQKKEEEERAAIERHCVWQKRLGEAGIPDRFRTRTLESYLATNEGQRRALDFALNFADSLHTAKRAQRDFLRQPRDGQNASGGRHWLALDGDQQAGAVQHSAACCTPR